MVADDAAPPATVRVATPDDAPMLAELGARTFRQAYAADSNPDDLEQFVAETFRPDVQTAELHREGSRYLVAEVAGAAVGYALLRDDLPDPSVSGDRPVMLAQLYVDEAQLGTGVGALLMRRCLEDAGAAGHDTLWLTVWERNPRAIAFYERWGFEHTGDLDFWFGRERQRDLVMSRPLPPPSAEGGA